MPKELPRCPKRLGQQSILTTDVSCVRFVPGLSIDRRDEVWKHEIVTKIIIHKTFANYLHKLVVVVAHRNLFRRNIDKVCKGSVTALTAGSLPFVDLVLSTLLAVSPSNDWGIGGGGKP